MVVHRKTLALDADLIDKLKEVAKRRGTTLSNYLRSLLREAIEIEGRGYYAPKALRERKYEYLLMNLGFVYVPKELVGRSNDAVVSSVSERLGSVMRELGIDLIELIDLLSSSCSNVISESRKIVILTLPNSAEYLIAKLIAGIAKSAGLKVKDEGALVTIEIPSEELSKKLSEFSSRRRRR